eukprot:2034507-Rhodomonas_salina.1
MSVRRGGQEDCCTLKSKTRHGNVFLSTGFCFCLCVCVCVCVVSACTLTPSVARSAQTEMSRGAQHCERVACASAMCTVAHHNTNANRLACTRLFRCA